MAKKEVFGDKKINVTATVNSVKKRLLTVVDSDEGSARIVLWAGKDWGYEPTGEKILQNKWSVHHTSSNPISNTIKRTTIIEGRCEEEVSVHRTKAIKQKDKFALVFYSTFCGMDLPIRAVTKTTDGQIMNIADYQTGEATLAVAVFAGAPDAVFDAPGTGGKYTAIHMRHFKLIFLSTLINIPTQDIATVRDQAASEHGINGFGLLAQPEPAGGMTPQGCMDMISLFNEQQIGTLLQSIYNKLPDQDSRNEMLQRLEGLGNIRA